MWIQKIMADGVMIHTVQTVIFLQPAGRYWPLRGLLVQGLVSPIGHYPKQQIILDFAIMKIIILLAIPHPTP